MKQCNNEYNLKWGAVAGLVLALTVISVVSINQYQFGTTDQALTIPFLKQFLQPELYPGDYLLAERPYYYTFLWNGLGIVHRLTGIGIPKLFFTVYFVSLYFSFLGMYLLALALFRRPEAAVLAVFFLLLSKGVPAGVTTLDRELATRAVVLPILLFALVYYIKGKYWHSAVLQGLGFLVHPLTAIYVIVMCLATSLVDVRRIGVWRVIGCLVVLAGISSPILVWKYLHSPPGMSLFYADPKWLELLYIRSPHHLFPFTWGRGVFVSAGVTLLVFLASWRHKPEHIIHRVVLVWAGVILMMCAAGVVFSEWVPTAVVLNLQPFRSFQFLMYLTIIYVGNYYVTEVFKGNSVWGRLGALVLVMGVLYKVRGWEPAMVLFLVMSAVLMVYLWWWRMERVSPGTFAVLWLCIAMVLGIGAYTKLGGMSIHNAQEIQWLDVQRWAKRKTDVSDGFIVPPWLHGFRVESERTVYGDWKDGTLMNFNPDFGYEWIRRMENLGYRKGMPITDRFQGLRESDYQEIAGDLAANINDPGQVFLVRISDGVFLDFPITYENKKFVVYKVTINGKS